MNIYDALILKALGGGGGTTVVANPEGEATDELEKIQVGSDIYGISKDYEEMSNKPSINSVELEGNKTASELGLQPTLDGAQTVSGNPITVADAEAMNAENVVVELEPKQDLHGYDAPWVGGAGKNKLKLEFESDTPTMAGMTFVHTESEYSINGTATFPYQVLDITNVPTMEAGSNYTLSVDVEGSLGSSQISITFQNSGQEVKRVSLRENLKIVTFQLESAYDGVSFILEGFDVGSSYNYSAKIMLEQGSIATSFEPYSNICPISGYSEVEVERVGKNQGDTYTIDLDGTKYGGTLDVTNGGYSDEWGYIEGDSVSDLVSAGATTGTTDAGLFYIAIAGVGVAVDNDSVATSDQLVCDNLENVSAIANWTTNVSGVCLNTDNNLTFAVKDITTQADMDTWLSNNPIQIAYRKKTPSSASTTPTDIPLLENTNNISTNGTNITLKYQPNNVIGECKAYTDEKCAEVLPPLPTTDGTYHLSFEVTSGVGVLSWVSDS